MNLMSINEIVTALATCPVCGGKLDIVETPADDNTLPDGTDCPLRVAFSWGCECGFSYPQFISTNSDLCVNVQALKATLMMVVARIGHLPPDNRGGGLLA